MSDTFVSQDEGLKSFGEAEETEARYGGADDQAFTDLARAAFVEGADGPEPLPDVGTPIVFYPRRGMGRMNLIKFPGVVQRVREDTGKIDVIVFFDIEDTMRFERVSRRSADMPEMVWDYPATRIPHEPFEPSRVNRLADDLAKLRAMLLGDFEEPAIPLFEIFADMEGRLKALAAEIETLKGLKAAK